MNNTQICFCIGILIIAGIILASVNAESEETLITFTGQVVYQDLEGGFWGIISDTGKNYQPLNLSEQYQVPGILVEGAGWSDNTISTIRMWGEPLRIESIRMQNTGGLNETAWYSDQEMNEISDEENRGPMTRYLLMAASALQKEMDQIDGSLARAAKGLRGKPMNENMLSPILSNFSESGQGVYESSALNTKGEIVAVVPDSYRMSLGTDVSTDFTISRVLHNPVPALSPYTTTIEGDNAVIITHPVFSDDNTVTGFISALVNPSVLIRESTKDILKNSGYALMIIQPDGTILYDTDPEEIGGSTWNESRFTSSPSLLSVAAHMQQARAGYGTYEYSQTGSEETVQKEIFWTTVSLHGTAWRIAIVSEG